MKHTSLFLLLLLALAGSAHAQRFGGALAISDDAIFVGETHNRMTPGAVYMYQRGGDGSWHEVHLL